ncbi:glycosyltransferase family 4 protein [Halosimplex amylolyticum]|uniref:glycosyltransferase family 4 protein n=1 Tax=Halosimplex amylolyticum TaxID=3396616 RepID=UPI003F55AE86
MKILYCSTIFPYPPDSGGRAEMMSFIQGLIDGGHEVTLLTYGNEEKAERADEIDCTVEFAGPFPELRASTLVKEMTSTDPLPVVKCRMDRYIQKVRQLLQDDYDVLHVHGLQTSFVISDISTDVPVVLRLANIKSEVAATRAAFEPIHRRLYAKYQAKKLRRYESRMTEEADLTLAISDPDARDLSARSSGRVDTLLPGVRIEEYEQTSYSEGGKSIVFFGSMSYDPNIIGAEWLVNEVFPLVQAEHPTAEIHIVGGGPDPRVKRLDNVDGVSVEGFVEDLHSRVRQADISVVPIKTGSGINMKTLHSMALGMPIVSTSFGVRGIPGKPNEEFLTGDSTEEFADQLNLLLSDQELQEEIGDMARETIIECSDYRGQAVRAVEKYRQLQKSEM